MFYSLLLYYLAEADLLMKDTLNNITDKWKWNGIRTIGGILTGAGLADCILVIIDNTCFSVLSLSSLDTLIPSKHEYNYKEIAEYLIRKRIKYP
jgi:hypothetical protein